MRFSPGYMAMAHQLPVAGVVEAGDRWRT
ncbi:hypothetical protein OHD17_00680 [Escherichia coli]|nr:hypothetical protein [Escherichia coli]